MEEQQGKEYQFDRDHLMNHIPGGIAIYKFADPLETLYFNDGVCALSGHTREEYSKIIQADAMNIVYEEDRPLLVAEIQSALQERRRVDLAYRIYHKERPFVWVQLSAESIREEDGYSVYYAIFIDISNERNTQKVLKKLAEHDSLTGALNRISFEKRVEKYLLNSKKSTSAFLMLDIDDFKQINDFLGHLKGDEVLCRVSNFLKEVFGTHGFVARMGGDEFGVFIPEIYTDKELIALVDEFFQLYRMEYDYQESKIHISCSMGIALSPQNGDTYTQLYATADKALIYAKNNGKNQYQVFGEFMKSPSQLLLRNMEWLLDEETNGIYVCNAETYELVYMNRLGRQIAGAKGNNYLGKKCYEELMHRSAPCTFCKMKELKRESFCEREFASPDGKRKLLLKGKIINWNGIKAHVEFITDITEVSK